MPLNTKNGMLLVKDGKLQTDCNCCGEWWCYCDSPSFGSVCNVAKLMFVQRPITPGETYWNGVLGTLSTWVLPNAPGIKTQYDPPDGPPSIYAKCSSCGSQSGNTISLEFGRANPKLGSLSYRQYSTLAGGPYVCAPNAIAFAVYRCSLAVISSGECQDNVLRATWWRRTGVREVILSQSGGVLQDAGQYFTADDSFATREIVVTDVTPGDVIAVDAGNPANTSWSWSSIPSYLQGNLTPPTSLDSFVHPITPYQIMQGTLERKYDSLYSLTYRQMRDAIIATFPAPTLSLTINPFTSQVCA